ncbi:MAG: tRNA (guanosine(46)-N7)-methyltransferase TrmB [Pseudomonadota bacterium]
MDKMAEHFPTQKTYGRRGGRPLSGRQKRLFETVLPSLRIPVSGTEQLDTATLFDRTTDKVWLEIGFGGGEHVSGQAKRHPDVGILASEVFIEGVAKLLGQIEDQKLDNVRLWDDDARDLMAALTPKSIDRAFILFPDPWPKKRQQKRRLIQTDFLDDLARIVKPGGRVRFATDVASYADEALERFLAHAEFTWTANCADDWRTPPSDHLTTRYEAKNLGDIVPVYFDFICNTAFA